MKAIENEVYVFTLVTSSGEFKGNVIFTADQIENIGTDDDRWGHFELILKEEFIDINNKGTKLLRFAEYHSINFDKRSITYFNDNNESLADRVRIVKYQNPEQVFTEESLVPEYVSRLRGLYIMLKTDKISKRSYVKSRDELIQLIIGQVGEWIDGDIKSMDIGRTIKADVEKPNGNGFTTKGKTYVMVSSTEYINDANTVSICSYDNKLLKGFSYTK